MLTNYKLLQHVLSADRRAVPAPSHTGLATGARGSSVKKKVPNAAPLTVGFGCRPFIRDRHLIVPTAQESATRGVRRGDRLQWLDPERKGLHSYGKRSLL